MAAKASRRQIARAVVRILRTEPKQRQAILRSVAAYMVETKQTRQLDLLVKDIARELQSQDKHLFAEVQTAFALDDAARRDLQARLQTSTGAASVELDETVVPELLSGVIVRTPEHQQDLSARRKLSQLASLSRS